MPPTASLACRSAIPLGHSVESAPSSADPAFPGTGWPRASLYPTGFHKKLAARPPITMVAGQLCSAGSGGTRPAADGPGVLVDAVADPVVPDRVLEELTAGNAAAVLVVARGRGCLGHDGRGDRTKHEVTELLEFSDHYPSSPWWAFATKALARSGQLAAHPADDMLIEV